MKSQVINDIIMMLNDRGINTDGITDSLYIIMRDVEIIPAETALVVRDDRCNDNLLNRFLAAKMVKGCTEKTIAAYKNTLRTILKRFNKSVIDITSDDIRLYTAYRLTQDGISKSFMNTELRYLRTFYAYLECEEIIQRNPMKKIDVIKEPKKKKKAFTELECERLRASCRTSMEIAIVELLLSTGCRVSELCMIQIPEIDGDKVTVHGKGNKDRIVYLNAKAQLAIEKYLDDRKDNNEFLFPRGINFNDTAEKKRTLNKLKGNKEWYKFPELISSGSRDKGSIEACVRKIGQRAGVENCHPHRFRRTCATMALRRGMPIELVSKMLGHEQISTTQIYLDLSEKDIADAHHKYVV